MSNRTLSAETRRSTVRLGAGLLAGTLVLWSVVGQAASRPDSFADLARQVTPAVVNIAATQKVTRAEAGMPEMPFAFPKGSPFEEFFKRFRERQGADPESGGRPPERKALGSGFIIDPGGYVVTNNHVIAEASEVTVTLGNDRQYPAKVVGTDEQTDLALLKIEARDPLPAVAFGDSDKAQVGDWVLAVGNPFGLGGTVTAGIISARGRDIQAGPFDDFLQIDAPVNQGNSGGPTFALDGTVIGVNTAIASPNGGSVGIGFAIPSNMAKTVIAQLRENGRVERGWLGVQIQVVSPEIAAALGLDSPAGALVASVVPDSPAAAAGLRQGDVILAFNGKDVPDMRALPRLVAETPAGKQADVEIWRDHKRLTKAVEIGRQAAKERLAAAEPAGAAGAPVVSKALGATLAAITPEYRQRFGVPDAVHGVIVVDLDSAGPGVAQGLRAGDVITQVGQTRVTRADEVDSLVEAARASDRQALLLLVNRRGDDLFLGFKLGVA